MLIVPWSIFCGIFVSLDFTLVLDIFHFTFFGWGGIFHFHYEIFGFLTLYLETKQPVHHRGQMPPLILILTKVSD